MKAGSYLRAAIDIAAVLVLAGTLTAWFILATLVDRHWLGTLLGFGPRWVFVLPIALMLPVAGVWRRRALAPLVVALVIALGPVGGFCLPRAWPGETDRLRLLTLNTDGRANPLRVLEVIASTRPDVVALQECGHDDRWADMFGAGWHVHQEGELLVASRHPIVETQWIESAGLPAWRRPALRCRIAGPQGTFDVVNVHLYTPRDGFEAVRSRRWQGIKTLTALTERRRQEAEIVAAWTASQGGPTIVAGDFNLPVESQIYRQCWGSYGNAFSRAGLGWGGTFRTRWHSVRIDHVLVDGSWNVVGARVAPNVGSAHLPLVADVRLLPPESVTAAR